MYVCMYGVIHVDAHCMRCRPGRRCCDKRDSSCRSLAGANLESTASQVLKKKGASWQLQLPYLRSEALRGSWRSFGARCGVQQGTWSLLQFTAPSPGLCFFFSPSLSARQGHPLKKLRHHLNTNFSVPYSKWILGFGGTASRHFTSNRLIRS